MNSIMLCSHISHCDRANDLPTLYLVGHILIFERPALETQLSHKILLHVTVTIALSVAPRSMRELLMCRQAPLALFAKSKWCNESG